MAVIVSTCALVGCAEPELGAGANDASLVERGPLIELDAFEIVAASEDPLANHRPAELNCPVAAWGLEDDSLEVQTGACNYLALGQDTLVAIAPGEELELDLWHNDLDAQEPALAHFAVLLDDRVVGEYEVEIPSAAAFTQLSWVAEQEVPAGTRLGLHLHNHGFNSWTVVRVGIGTHE